ncbi:site-specific integrase [Pseudonocardia sp.]|uniref:site-specific integrase n=1 Tax=Pseudonocardia sp. TaxID=60912 RepID=UPI003D122FC5
MAREFGNVRKLPSGRWQARYHGPDGQRRSAPYTFDTKTAAMRWLRLTEAEVMRGEWTDPDRARVPLHDYAEQWIRERPGLRPRTVELYGWLLGKHIVPHLGDVELGKLSTALVRRWRADLLAAGVSESIAAKSYRLLRAVLNTAAAEDHIIRANPCRVRGADREKPAERPTLTVAQVFALADRMPHPRYRVLVLLTAFCSLRWGEVSALRRCDIADDGSWVRVTVAHTEVAGRGIVVGPPKSRAGLRTIVVPEAIRAELVQHLRGRVGPAPSALVFTGDQGRAIRRSNFSQRVKWTETVKKIGVPGLHFHDLRHAGNVWAAQTRVSTRDLMARMGHDDMRAALIYQRATQEAAERIARGLSDLADQHRNPDGTDDDPDDDGATGALVPAG